MERMDTWTQLGRGSGTSEESSTWSCVKCRAGDELPCGAGSPAWPSDDPEGPGVGREGAPQRGAVCVITADSRHCTAKARTML